MGLLLNSSLSDAAPPSVREQHFPASAVSSVIVLVGVLTFALQLTLVALFLYKCWSYDKQIRETHKGKQPRKPPAKDSVSLLTPQYDGGFHSGMALAAAGLYSAPLSHSCSYDEELGRLSPATPHLPCNAWDLVQH